MSEYAKKQRKKRPVGKRPGDGVSAENIRLPKTLPLKSRYFTAISYSVKTEVDKRRFAAYHNKLH